MAELLGNNRRKNNRFDQKKTGFGIVVSLLLCMQQADSGSREPGTEPGTEPEQQEAPMDTVD